MPLYNYQAIDALGKKRHGLLEAHSDREAKDKLRDQGLMVTKIETKVNISNKQNLRGDHLIAFTVQLSQLVSAGVPLYESLLAIEEQYRTEPFHRVILSLCEQIKAGTALSEAMGVFPGSFSKLYRAMIAAGESIGALDIVLEKLSQLLVRQSKLKKQITTAMIYPAILASFSFLIILLLLGFVVPSIEGIFADRQLNGFTQFILSLSHLFRDWWWFFLPLMGLTIAYLVYKIRSPVGKLWMQRNFLKVPLIRTLMIQTAMARFCRTMGTLQMGGLTMIESLRISREVMQNVVLEEEIKKAETKIIEGSSLSAELNRSKWIPPMISRMLAVGEDAGSTVTMLNKIAEMYEDELEKTLDRLMALAQPVILIVMGLVIGCVLLGIMLPLTDVSSFSL
jgi:general secretion pathway protein F